MGHTLARGRDCNMCKVPSRSADAVQRCIKNIMDAQKNTEGGHTRGPLDMLLAGARVWALEGGWGWAWCASRPS